MYQYLKYLTGLCVRTCDLDTLMILCKRFRSDDSLQVRGELQTEAKMAILDIIKSKVSLTGNYVATLCSRFSNLTDDVEEEILKNYDGSEICDIYWLAVACDLKKISRGDYQPLDEFITNLYSKLYLATGVSSVPGKPISVSAMSKKCLIRAGAITKAVSVKSEEEPNPRAPSPSETNVL